MIACFPNWPLASLRLGRISPLSVLERGRGKDDIVPTIDLNELTVTLLRGDFLKINELFRDAGACDPEIRLNPAEEDIDSLRLKSLFQYWTALPRGPKLPLSQAIDAVEIGPALGIVMLLQTLPDPFEFRYRVYGSEIALISKMEWTGKTTKDLPSPEMRAFFQATYAAAVQSGAPLLSYHQPPTAYGMSIWSRLILPCEDGAGRIDRLLVGNEPAFPKLVGRTPWPYA